MAQLYFLHAFLYQTHVLNLPLNRFLLGLPSIHATKRISGDAMAHELENFTLVHIDASSHVVGSLEDEDLYSIDCHAIDMKILLINQPALASVIHFNS